MSDVNADKIPVPAQPEVLLHCLMDIAEALLAVGAEVNRVEDTLTRMGTAYGAVRMNAFVITSSIVVTMTLPSGRDITQTRRILTPGGTDFTVLEALKLFRTGLIGMDPLDVEGIHRMMDRLLSGNTSAKAAVDIALYDIKGKLMGQPLYKVLGGSVNQIVTDMTVGIDTPEAMAAEARERVEKDGFTILKIKAGINPTEDIQALTLIRQAVGPNIRLRVDANQGYTVSDAVRTLKAFEELGVEAVEQCLPSWDLDGMRFVRSKVDLQVMLDESVHTPIDAAKACKIDAADIINIKLMKCGGLYPAEKINAIAEANHVQCMVGCMLETKVAIAAGVSLVAAKQNITEADCDSFMYAVDPEMGMPGGFAVNGGVYTLSDKPGLGIDIDF